MDKAPSKMFKVQVIIIAYYLFGTAFSAALFGIDISAPRKGIMSGAGDISRVVFRQNNNQQANPSAFSNNDSYETQKGNILEAKPVKTIEKFRFTPPSLPLPGSKQNAPETPVKFANSETIDNKTGSAPLKPAEEKYQNIDESEVYDGSFTLGWSYNGTDYTTEISEYETTTDESLNRIGNVPPAALASLLGSG